ncbi:MAG: hypothetical protein KGP28_13010 [Bdellovibrionales bacterium]|nr:hypothetical protein [Bdellovibrionales bacterium]
MKKVNGFICILASMLMVACGSSSTRDFTTSGLGGGGTTGGGGSTSTTGGTTGGNIYNDPLAPDYLLRITGPGTVPPYPGTNYTPVALPTSQTFSAITSRLLRVKVTPLPAPNLSSLDPDNPYGNWVFPYGCLQLSVTIGGVTRQTMALRVANVAQDPGSACANAPSSQILDFSNITTSSSAAYSIVVSNPVYDNCRGTSPMQYGTNCTPYWNGYQWITNVGMKAVQPNHIVSATIAVQVDGQYME